MPGLTSLGDILQKEGYHQTLFIGSDAEYGGRKQYFTQHGDYEIIDYEYAKSAEWIPSDYLEWWGFEDEKLFSFAKEKLTEIANNEEPFNFTMLTADTHFPDGYVNENTPELFENQYSNVIHYSDEMLGDFIDWIKLQPFYENTTVVITGDHLSMDTNFFEGLEQYDRRVYNAFLNSSIQPNETSYRYFSLFDMFPTTLASMGIEIADERLGLGTNLFSTKPTLIEELGYDYVYEELQKNSTFYNKVIMQDSDFKIVD